MTAFILSGIALMNGYLTAWQLLCIMEARARPLAGYENPSPQL